MSALLATPTAPASDGLTRSAALLRALGARAANVWSSLSPEEARKLSSAMQSLPDDADLEARASQAYVREMTAISPNRPPGVATGSLWSRLSAQDGQAIAALLRDESPQVMAVILSWITSEAAASTIRCLPQAQATEVLRRLLHLGPVLPAALKAIEHSLQDRIGAAETRSTGSGHERVAAIFDRLDSRVEQGLLAELDQAEPGTGERVRALMFSFDDLSNLGPASLQTILAGVDRAILILALKGARESTAKAFYDNMTMRAGELLRSEIEATGPVRRSEIEAARNQITALARSLVDRGDILAGDEDDDELVE